jgi:hypothetical protein
VGPSAALSAALLGRETRETAAATARDEIHLIEVIEAFLVCERHKQEMQ